MAKYKVGQILYSAHVFMDDETGRLSGGLTEYTIRTIRGGKVYAIQKMKDVTWVKKSRKHHDWGWSDNISPWMRCSFKLDGSSIFNDIATTKRGAWSRCLKTHRELLVYWKKRDKMDGFIPIIEKEIKYCERKVKSLTKQTRK